MNEWDEASKIIKDAGFSLVFMDYSEVRILDTKKEAVFMVDMVDVKNDKELLNIVKAFVAGVNL